MERVRNALGGNLHGIVDRGIKVCYCFNKKRKEIKHGRTKWIF
jgi:hypothetical protein